MKKFIPGLPKKTESTCIDSEQSFIPHIIDCYTVIQKNDHEKCVKKTYQPNLEYYPEYLNIIIEYIKNHK